MSESYVNVDPKHGLNPTCIVCYVCGESHSIALVGSESKKIFGTEEAPRESMDGSICESCTAILDQGGVFFIEVNDGETDQQNPNRTGRLWGITREGAERIVNDKTLLDKGLVWIEESIAKQIGFHEYREEDNNDST